MSGSCAKCGQTLGVGRADVPDPALYCHPWGSCVPAESRRWAASLSPAQALAVRVRELEVAGLMPYEIPRPPGRPQRMLLVDRLGFERIEPYTGGRYHVVAAVVGDGVLHVEFEPYGITMRNGEQLYEFRERSQRRSEMFAEPIRNVPSADTLAMELFRSDPDVVAFVSGVADNEIAFLRRNIEPPKGAPVDTAAAVSPERYERAVGIAWQRDEKGWASRARARAAEIVGSLKKGNRWLAT